LQALAEAAASIHIQGSSDLLALVIANLFFSLPNAHSTTRLVNQSALRIKAYLKINCSLVGVTVSQHFI